MARQRCNLIYTPPHCWNFPDLEFTLEFRQQANCRQAEGMVGTLTWIFMMQARLLVAERGARSHDPLVVLGNVVYNVMVHLSLIHI